LRPDESGGGGIFRNHTGPTIGHLHNSSAFDGGNGCIVNGGSLLAKDCFWRGHVWLLIWDLLVLRS
jgi:hypothetical protein